MAFANVTSFLYVRSEPTKESEYVGKLYPGYAAKITGPVGEWTAVESGDVTGYVKTEYILTGAEAQTYAENLVTEAQQEGKEEAFTYAVSRKSEEAQMTQEVRKMYSRRRLPKFPHSRRQMDRRSSIMHASSLGIRMSGAAQV